MPRKDGATLRRWYCFEVNYGPRYRQFIGRGFVSLAELATLTDPLTSIEGNLVRVGPRDMNALRMEH